MKTENQATTESSTLNFYGLESNYSNYADSRIAILSVPYDGTSTYNKGADRGPQAILEASTQVELYDIETDFEVYQLGIVGLAPVTENSSPEEMVAAVKARVSALLQDGKFPVILGGEHSVSAGAIQACKESYPNISTLQFDAHGDTREEYYGSRYNHACVMARARECGPIVQVGIRAIDSSELEKMDRSRVVFAHQIKATNSEKNWPEKNWIDRVSKGLTSEVYLTIDLDCFDSAIMPSTGTPEPGGLNWYDLLDAVRQIADRHNIIGLDIVELLPRESDPAPNFLAAKLLYQVLSIIFKPRQLAAA
ncbi:agmatinase [bacterium]|nr:agmatinase [bacterium]